jgi:hypothetical protein
MGKPKTRFEWASPETDIQVNQLISGPAAPSNRLAASMTHDHHQGRHTVQVQNAQHRWAGLPKSHDGAYLHCFGCSKRVLLLGLNRTILQRNTVADSLIYGNQANRVTTPQHFLIQTFLIGNVCPNTVTCGEVWIKKSGRRVPSLFFLLNF